MKTRSPDDRASTTDRGPRRSGRTTRTLLVVSLLLVGPVVSAHAGGPLHRDSLLAEIASGRRKLFGHDSLVSSPSDPGNHFLLVRDQMAGPGREHALGIFSPPGQVQPPHIRDVQRSDAGHLGRMIRSLMFADRKSDYVSPDPSRGWHLYVNLSPAVPRLHIHAQEARRDALQISDWNAFAKQHGYQLAKKTSTLHVWHWSAQGRAPQGWDVLAVANAKLGAPATLEALAPKKSARVDRAIGEAWLEAAALSRGGQVEASRSDSQIVARGVAW